jgi:Flp pilus assembly protein TadG
MKMKSHSGQAMVEFALILPLLLILIFGVIEFSILLYDKAVITNASREGARHGIVAPATSRQTQTEIASVVSNYCASNLITFGISGNLNTTAPTAPTVSGTTIAFGIPLTVTVNYTYSFFVLPKFIGNAGTLNMQATTVMNYE